MNSIRDFIHVPRVAYFSMEIALDGAIPTYSGGLGILAGDTLRSAADLELPMVAVTLVSRSGYFRQQIDAQGRQVELPESWDPAAHCVPIGAKVGIEIGGRTVWITGWLYVIRGHMNGRQPVILLDTWLPENHPDDKELTHYLYGGDAAYRLKQEIILGIGGTRLLSAFGFRIRQYHMNEGHSALLGLELLNRYSHASRELQQGESPYDMPFVRGLCCFTTHTPVEAGHDQFPYALVQNMLDDFVPLDVLQQLAGKASLNMTRLALNLSEYVNGVARRHAEVARRQFPGYRVRAITNGVHPWTWTHPAFRELYDRYFPTWCHEPEQLVKVDCCLPAAELRQAHVLAKQQLLALVRERSGVTLHPEYMTIGFARRMTEYKRPDLLFADLARLRAIAREHPLQIIMAGKAHPKDDGGKRAIEHLHRLSAELGSELPVVFLANYDMNLALPLVAGVDVWLNTPMKPLEASGTSGMKAAFNGVPQLSVLDGWWLDGCIEGVTGWAIGDASEFGNGDTAMQLYDKLQNVVLPLFYGDPGGWLRLMQGAIGKNASVFNSHRMMRRYATEAYIV
ncbi:MAG: alpha-glucan family phosphorylase [Gammaproteobacteria bacterium]